MTRYTDAQLREATEWFLLIKADDVPNSDALHSWLRWMEYDEGNRLAFESVAAVWHAVPCSTALAMPTTVEVRNDGYEGKEPVADWLAERAAEPRQVVTRVLAWRVAAALAVLAVGTLTMVHYLNPNRTPQDEFSTKYGEQLELTLADGSRVSLGPRSVLHVQFSKGRRGIELATGEAYFSVKKDRTRPFVVSSAGGEITAVGTAFDVRALTERVTVAVSEGTVSVAPRGLFAASSGDSVRVTSGQQLTFAAREPLETLRTALEPSTGERARWRDGVLVYRDEPLREVVMDVARYSDKRLELSGDAIGALHYTGVVYKTAIDEWMSALAESFPVRVVNEGDRQIILAR